MKAVILAAGNGKRLGLDIPKALVQVDNELTIFDLQIANLLKYFDEKDIYVVVGYKRELFKVEYPKLNYVDNIEFDTTNTAKSLLMALECTGKQDVLWLNGDVVFDPDILSLFMERTDQNLISVNKESVGEEEIKYQTDVSGKVTALSKTVKNGEGEAPGINFISRNSLQLFKEKLELCADTDYFEKAVEYCISEGECFYPLDIGSKFCVEVDFQEDLKAARNVMLTRKNAGQAISVKV